MADRAAGRDPRVDYARGVASLIMIQGHAFHGWVSPEHKATGAYLFTRIFATLPLPAFLVLAGTAVAYRMRAAQRRGESARSVRAALVRRGLQVTGAGYLVNIAYALLDGWESWAVLLRADVLQVIGLSIAALGLCIGGDLAPPTARRAAARVLGLGAAVTLACPWLSSLGAALSLAGTWPTPWANPMLAYPAALLVEVPEVTRMPLVPLFAWTAVGWAAGTWLTAPQRAHQRERPLIILCAAGLTLAWVGATCSDLALQGLGGPLTRTHPAVAFNVLEYAGRGLLVLGAAPLLVARLPEAARKVVTNFGRASLWAYVFHIPFCYGRLGQLLRDRMDVGSAVPFVVVLMAVSYLVVLVRLRWSALPFHRANSAPRVGASIKL